MKVYRIKDNNIFDSNFSEMKKDKASQYWVIASPDELYQNNDYFKFHNSTVEECMSPRQNPRIEVYDDTNFGVINIIEKDQSGFSARELNFYLAKDKIVFVVKEKHRILNDIIGEIFDNSKASKSYLLTVSKILYILLDRIASSDSGILNEIEVKISKLEEQVMSDARINFTADIVKLRKQLLYLKRYYEPLVDIIEDLEENENGLIDDSAIRYFRILNNRVLRLNNNVLNLRDYITQVREAYQAQVDISLNRIMKVFTVVTTIFLPLTLIAGWYGMNFKHMPELNWIYGYPFAFVLSGIVVAISIAYFKKHNLLK